MTSIKMPIVSATLTVTGDGASGGAQQIYDSEGFIVGMENVLTVPSKGTFTLDIVTTQVYPFDTQTLGGGAPEWVTLQDATNKGTVAAIRVTGTAPEGFTGAVPVIVNGMFGGEEYSFPDGEEPLTLAVKEISKGITFTYEDGGPVGLGFFNRRRLRIRIDSISYVAGGLQIPYDFHAEDIIAISAKGGYLAYLDKENQRVQLFISTSTEASGTIEDLSIMLIGQ